MTSASANHRDRDFSKSGPSPEGGLLRVLLPLPLAGAYDYLKPEGLAVAAGDFVSVPIGGRRMIGVVWGAGGENGVAASKLKSIEARCDAPPMTEALRRFIDWVAAYTLSPPGAVLKMAMSVPDALIPPAPVLAYRLAAGHQDNPAWKPTAQRSRVADILSEGAPRPLAEIAREAAVGLGVVRGLAALGVLEGVPAQALLNIPAPDGARPGPVLSPDQAQAASALVNALDAGFSVNVIDGVTGSGKTEVYFEAIAAALRAGRQVLVLLPEIALSAQWLDRFAARFGAAPRVWHSQLPAAQRRRTWRALAEGQAQVVVGARSALFLPLPRLGLIVVDEEQDSAFKQEDGVMYHARDMAVVRGRTESCAVALVSATPSLETMTNAQAGRYRRLHLPDRHGGALLPDVQAIDMRREVLPRGRWLSPSLAQAVARALEAGEQALLFLNRRGFAPLTLCRACGHRLACPHCSAWLVEHRQAGRLQCHHCGHAVPRPAVCPACAGEDSLVACGPGVERLADEVAALFPAARQAVMASDTVATPKQAEELIRQMQAREIDILIGTQVVAKGHHFPLLTLVGVVDADLGLAGGDLRAAERTFQLLWQVAGRAGRENRPGRVLLQTYEPEHPVMKALATGDRDRFLAEESRSRAEAEMPPFGRLAALIVSAPDADAADRAARALARIAPQGQGIAVFGPAPAPLSLLRGRHRRRLLLKTSRSIAPQGLLRNWLAGFKSEKGVRVQVDIDPQSFF